MILKTIGFMLSLCGVLSAIVQVVHCANPHYVYREDWKETRCGDMLNKVRKQLLSSPQPPTITGDWVSTRCEIRSGPEYVIRHFRFYNATFHSIVYHYSQPDCHTPLYAIESHGPHHLIQPSWTVQGATEASYEVSVSYVIPYTKNVTHQLAKKLAVNCKDLKAYKHLRPFSRHTIYKLPPPDAYSENNKTVSSIYKMEKDCFHVFNFSLHELQLVYVQQKKYGHKYHQRYTRHHHRLPHNKAAAANAAIGNETLHAPPHMTRELLLGAVHSRPSRRHTHRPSSFQTPLKNGKGYLVTRVKRSNRQTLRGDYPLYRHVCLDKTTLIYLPLAHGMSKCPIHFGIDQMTVGCGLCSRIMASDPMYPPRLSTHSGTLLSLEGQWVSTRCESRQYGMFLTRWLKFLSDGTSWQGQYDYYHDPLCQQQSFSLIAKGGFIGGTTSHMVEGAKDYSFKVTRLKIKPHDIATTNSLNHYGGKGCGKAHAWKVGVEQDVTWTGGCVTLGIRLPNMERDIMKMEIVHRKLHLFVGQRLVDKKPGTYQHERPTAFQEALVKCDDENLDMSVNTAPGGHSWAGGVALPLASGPDDFMPSGNSAASHFTPFKTLSFILTSLMCTIFRRNPLLSS